MSDIVRMLRVSESDPVQQEAADEIERLRAELAAEREKTADYGNQIDRLADEIDWVEDEVVTQEKALGEVEAERDALRAELATEREKTDKISRLYDTLSWEHEKTVEHVGDMTAERDALRALLREAREYTGYAAFYGDRIEADHAADLCARIDAALNKGGMDE